MFSRSMLALKLLMLFVAGANAQANSDHRLPIVAPLDKMKAAVVENLYDPDKPGEVFEIRIHDDAGYIAMQAQTTF